MVIVVVRVRHRHRVQRLGSSLSFHLYLDENLVAEDLPVVPTFCTSRTLHVQDQDREYSGKAICSGSELSRWLT